MVKVELRGWRLVEEVNKLVRLQDILTDLGVDALDGVPSWKTHCPLGYEHGDGGVERAMRYYGPSNSAYCFAMHGVFTPVTLLAKVRGKHPFTIAEELYNDADLGNKTTYLERFEAAQRAAETRDLRSALAAELLKRLGRHPDWLRRQLDPDVLDAVGSALDKLDTVDQTSASDLRAWFDSSLDEVQELLPGWRV